MAWFLILAVAVAVGWVVLRRGVPRLVFPGEAPAPVREIAPVEDDATRRKARNLYAAFRTEEYKGAQESEREDRRLLQRSLQLLADHVGADQAVLWRPEPGEDGLLPVVWCVGTAEPTLNDSDRLLVELSASEQRATHNASSPTLALVAVGVMLGNDRGAVSVHFREAPSLDRTTLTEWTQRHARTIADLFDVSRNRARLASRTNKLWWTIRTAKALQGSRDPVALEQALARDATLVAGAQWAIVVRWDAAAGVATRSSTGDGAPDFGEAPRARQGSIVGDVCRTGEMRRFSDARPLISSREFVFDGTPLPEGTLSFVVLPLRRSEKDTAVGALLLGHAERGAITQHDASGALDLGTIAAGALETAWAVRDETERARTDPLTTLPNRRAFDEAFGRMLAETDRFGGASALVLVDIDHFKRINDTYGHAVGDEVLKVVGAALASERRTTDFVARLGGEEFALLLPQTDQHGALEVAERVRIRIQGLRALTTAGEVTVTASFGVALYAARSGSGAALFDRADAALYAAKHGGRNRVEVAPGQASPPA